MSKIDPKGYEKMPNGKFRVRITYNKKIIPVGLFKTESEAKEAFFKAKAERGIESHNIIGRRFGKLIVLEYAGKTKGCKVARWLCQCDCGGKVLVQSSAMKNSNTRSCGCYKRERTHQTHIKDFGESSFNRTFRYYQKNAERKFLEFSLTTDEFKYIAQQNCHYCNVSPSAFFKRNGDYGKFYYNGIDRKDNFLGYTLENSLPCCAICNRAKSNMKYMDFIEYVERFKGARNAT